MAIEDDDPDDLLFDVILTAGSNSMTIDKTFEHTEGVSRAPSIESVVHAAMNSKQLHDETAGGLSRTTSLGRTASIGRVSSTGSRRARWTSAFERVKSNPKLERTEAYFSRLGTSTHTEGTCVLVKPAHPPASLDAHLDPQNDPNAVLEGKIAVFTLHPLRMKLAMIYDCAFRAEQQRAAGAIFCIRKPELVAAERYDGQEMQKSFNLDNEPAPKRLNIPVICVSELMKNVIQDGALVLVMPNTSIVRGLIADDDPSVRAAALRTLSSVARRNDPKLIEVLLQLILDPQDEVRRVCVETLSNANRVWPGNPVAIEELARSTTNESWHVRAASMTALCKVANCDKETCDPDVSDIACNLLYICAVKTNARPRLTFHSAG